MKCPVCNRRLAIETDATAMSSANEESAECACGYVWEWAYGAEREWFGFCWVYEWGWWRRAACWLWQVATLDGCV